MLQSKPERPKIKLKVELVEVGRETFFHRSQSQNAHVTNAKNAVLAMEIVLDATQTIAAFASTASLHSIYTLP
jgi:hypothetical protein